MHRFYQIFLIVFLLSSACSNSNHETTPNRQSTGIENSGNESSEPQVTKPVVEEATPGSSLLTRNQWCVKARFGHENYEYRLHFKENLQMKYAYFHLKPDMTTGELAQEGDGAWNLVGDLLIMLMADEEQQVKIRLDSTSALGHPQLHFNPGAPSMLTFNPCQ